MIIASLYRLSLEPRPLKKWSGDQSSISRTTTLTATAESSAACLFLQNKLIGIITAVIFEERKFIFKSATKQKNTVGSAKDN